MVKAGGDAPPAALRREALAVDTSVKREWFARQIADLVPNPWQAARIAGELIGALRAHGLGDEAIYAQRGLQASNLREHVTDRVERRAEQAFREKLRAGEIRFDLEVGQPNFRMPEEFERSVAANDPPLTNYGQPVQKSLFDLALDRDFNGLEKRFALYLDEREAIRWWHRVAVRQQHDYYLRGWKPDRIWPDFVAMSDDSGSDAELLIVETKGRHLDNPDTKYKERVLAELEQRFNEYGAVNVTAGPAKGRFRIVFREKDFPLAVP